MLKQICLLIITSFFCACVATKPVATKAMFHSEWNPVLTIQIPKGFFQLGPYIVDGKNRKPGYVREEHYPYIECDDDGSVSRINSITILAFGQRKRWEISTEGELDKVSVAGGVTTSGKKPYITTIRLQEKASLSFLGKLKSNDLPFSSFYISKSYITPEDWKQPRTIIIYVEKINENLSARINKWKTARLAQRIPAKYDRQHIPDTNKYPPSEDIREYLEQFEKKADSIISAQHSKRAVSLPF